MKPKISVIIPVYNVEKYIEKCLSSVLNQTLKDLEIIIINDGSTDRSEEIIFRKMEYDQRIKYFKHDNIGLGKTRNRGISIACGEYISFIDSDDYIEETMLELLYLKAKQENSDVVCGQVIINYESGNKKLRQDLSNVTSYSLKKQSKERFIKEYYFGRIYSHNACDKIYKTNFIKTNNIVFGDNKRIFSEDNFFQLQIMEYADVISFVPEDVYHYVQRDGSIMNSYKKDLINRHMNMIYDYANIVMKEDSELNKKINSMLTIEIVIMEVLNVIESNLGFMAFYKNICTLRKNELFNLQVGYFIEDKSYSLEPNLKRRLFLYYIAKMINLNLYFALCGTTYIRYKYLR